MEELKKIKQIIREYIKDNFLFGYSDEELKDDISFFEIGALDSTGIMELVTFIEREFNVSVLDEEIVQENLDSINLIASFVSKKAAM
jgi:acyl carrier protein